MKHKEKVFWTILSMFSMTAISIVWSLSNAFADAIITANSSGLSSTASVKKL